jgi:riboflavin kinase/FMN adenylyltransferase
MMRILRDFSQCPAELQGAVVALGNFDGVHLGHQAILRRCVAQAKALGAVPAVMTFAPHPREFFSRRPEGLRLQSFRQKMEIFAKMGIEAVFLVRFNARFAALSPLEFVEGVLHRDLRARHVVTGYNFAFGKGRGGDTAFLAQAAEGCGMGFTACPPVQDAEGQVVSSSAIRRLLGEGKVAQASALLGHGYAIEGRVVHGDKRGRTIGYPTANVRLGRLFRPAYGVYAVRMAVAGGPMVPGVANLGIRPMFAVEEPLLEVHGFDMQAMLYGKRVQVELVAHIRDEQRFDTLEALRAQIGMDSEQARAILLKEQRA